MAKKYHLWTMEENIINAYNTFKKEATEETRTQMVIAIKELALAILNIGKVWNNYKIDFEETSFEYAIYMFQRIASGKFEPEGSEDGKYGKRFPWQQYIRMNLKHVVITMSSGGKDWLSYYESVNDLMDKDVDESDHAGSLGGVSKSYHNKERAGKIIRVLNMFYPKSEVNRLYPMSREYVDQFLNGKKHLIPEDIKEFLTIFVSVTKRLFSSHIDIEKSIKNSNFKSALEKSVKSTLFLSLVANTEKYPRELLLSLDLDSLYRLVFVAGGETIRIPTKKELNNLIGAVDSASKCLLEGHSVEEAIKRTKREHGMVFSLRRDINVVDLVNTCIKKHDVFKENFDSKSMMEYLTLSSEALFYLVEKIKKQSEDLDMVDSISAYRDISDSFNKFTDSVIKINDRMSKEIGGLSAR